MVIVMVEIVILIDVYTEYSIIFVYRGRIVSEALGSLSEDTTVETGILQFTGY